MAQMWWLLGGVFVAGFAFSALITRLTRSPAERIHRAAIRELWILAKRIPSDHPLVDPETGQLVGVERRFGLLWLIVADPPPAAADQAAEPLATVYDLGGFGRPAPPPLLRRQQPLIPDEDESPMTWAQARELLRFNDAIGALNATSAEIDELLNHLRRALAQQR